MAICTWWMQKSRSCKIQHKGDCPDCPCCDTIIDQAQAEAYRAVDITLIKRNWLLGMRINKDVLKEQRAEYGKQVVKNLSLSLIERYGRGFSMRNLYNFVDFYQSHPDIFHAVSGESEFTDILQSLTAKSLIKEKHLTNILQALTAKSPIRLTWSHYAIILQAHTGTVPL